MTITDAGAAAAGPGRLGFAAGPRHASVVAAPRPAGALSLHVPRAGLRPTLLLHFRDKAPADLGARSDRVTQPLRARG